MNPKWIDAIQLIVYGDGLSMSEVAEEIKVSHQTVYNWRKNPEFQKLLAEEFDNKINIVRDMFKSDTDKVYNRMLNIAVNSKNEGVAIKAGQFIMEQAIGKAANKLDLNNNVNIKNEIDSNDILDLFEEEQE